MESSQGKNKTLVDKIWDFFASIKLAAVSFGLIALSSIIGTVIEQGAEPEKNLQVLTKLFGATLAPTLYRIFEALGFMDMYHSWWFLAFLVLFSVNLIICSFERLPNRIRMVKQTMNPIPLEKFSAFPIKNEVKLNKSPEKLRDSVRSAIKKVGFNTSEVSETGSIQFYSQREAFSRLGVYVTHLSILLIFIGAVIGIFFGFNGFLNLPEGYSSEVAYSRKGGKAYPLGFTIKLDDFDVEFYDNSDAPKDYKSWLTVTKNGQVVKKQVIEVNTPLRHEGYTFYQASYGASTALLTDPRGIFIFKVVSRTGTSEIVNLALGDSFRVIGTDMIGKVTDFSPALAFRQNGTTFTYSDMMNNPAAYVTFSEKGEEVYSGWLLKRYPQTWTLPDGNRVEFIDFWGSQYTGLQVRKDPGVWLVYLGCIIMSVGLYITFFMSHKKIWVALKQEGKNNSRVLVAATANKNRPSFERTVDRLIKTISKDS